MVSFVKNWKIWNFAKIRYFGSPWVLFGSIPCHWEWFRHFRFFSIFFNSCEIVKFWWKCELFFGKLRFFEGNVNKSITPPNLQTSKIANKSITPPNLQTSFDFWWKIFDILWKIFDFSWKIFDIAWKIFDYSRNICDIS